jgi:predicted deacylase
MKYKINIILYFVTCLVFSGVSNSLAVQKTHTVFFGGEENEPNVYRINGAKPGKTLLIVGGIQWGELGGFLAADFYADFSLEQGSLIVVPRANSPSILKKEGKINLDMNRKFLDDDIPNYEAKLVGVLKKLICESDYFFNLHEGSDIYSPT